MDVSESPAPEPYSLDCVRKIAVDQYYICSIQSNISAFYNTYLGENMTSVLFQEVREFRSYAYSTASALLRPVWKNRAEEGSALVTVTGTQCDKTMEAMALVDSLLQHLPVTENKLEIKKKECINDLYHNYPAFRAVPEYVLQSVWAGDGTDNKKEQAANFAAVTPASNSL